MEKKGRGVQCDWCPALGPESAAECSLWAAGRRHFHCTLCPQVAVSITFVRSHTESHEKRKERGTFLQLRCFVEADHNIDAVVPPPPPLPSLCIAASKVALAGLLAAEKRSAVKRKNTAKDKVGGDHNCQ